MATKTRKDPASSESKELFLTLGQDEKVAIRSKLLQCLDGEQLAHVRNKIGDAVAEIARQYTDSGTSMIGNAGLTINSNKTVRRELAGASG